MSWIRGNILKSLWIVDFILFIFGIVIYGKEENNTTGVFWVLFTMILFIVTPIVLFKRWRNKKNLPNNIAQSSCKTHELAKFNNSEELSETIEAENIHISNDNNGFIDRLKNKLTVRYQLSRANILLVKDQTEETIKSINELDSANSETLTNFKFAMINLFNGLIEQIKIKEYKSSIVSLYFACTDNEALLLKLQEQYSDAKHSANLLLSPLSCSQVNGLNLDGDCYFKCSAYTQKQVTKTVGYTGGGISVSIPTGIKGVKFRTGGGRAKAIKEKVTEVKNTGKLYVTSEEIVYVHDSGNTAIKIKNIFTIQMYSNCVHIQTKTRKTADDFYIDDKSNIFRLSVVLGKLGII